MKQLFSTPHLIEAQALGDLLQSKGIDSFLKNEDAAFFAQGTIETGIMPEVWVSDESFARALEVKKDWLESKSFESGSEPA